MVMFTAGFEAFIVHEINFRSLFLFHLTIYKIYPGPHTISRTCNLDQKYNFVFKKTNNDKEEKSTYFESLPTIDLFATAIDFHKIKQYVKYELVFQKITYLL